MSGGHRLVHATLLILALIQASNAADAPQTRPADVLAELLPIYQRYGLPLPLPDAPLVRFDVALGKPVFPGEARKNVQTERHLGFMLRPPSKDAPGIFLMGTKRYIARYDPDFEDVTTRPDAPAGVESIWVDWLDNNYALNIRLATAIQCKARGMEVLAASLAKHAMFSSFEYHWAKGAPWVEPRQALAEMAWRHWYMVIAEPGSDKKQIAAAMKAILAGEPQLDTPIRRNVIRSLEAGAPRASQPGSFSAMIDALADAGDELFQHSSYLRLEESGLESVPALLEHVDDDRLTRNAERPVRWGEPVYFRVREVVGGLLIELADVDLEEEAVVKGEVWPRVNALRARNWWAAIQKESEETYLVRNALRQDKGKWYPRQRVLQLIGRRYPHQLPGIYRRSLDVLDPKDHAHTMAELVSGSELSQDAKVALLLEGVAATPLAAQRPILETLASLDQEVFVKHAVAAFDRLPRTPEEPYWRCDEGDYARLALLTDDPRVWAALRRAAERADIGLRMEYMDCMTTPPVTPRQRKLRLEFMAGYLNDERVRDRDESGMFSGPCAGFKFDRIEVRNFAALQMGSLLGLSMIQRGGWIDGDWADLRDLVRKYMREP